MISAQRAIEVAQAAKKAHILGKIDENAQKGGYATNVIHKDWFFPTLETELAEEGFTINKRDKTYWYILWKPNTNNDQCI